MLSSRSHPSALPSAASLPEVCFEALLGTVEDTIHSFRRDPSDVARARLERVTSDFRAAQRATALGRWRGNSVYEIADATADAPTKQSVKRIA